MKVKFLQEGGAVPAPAEAAAQASPEEQVMGMAQQVVQEMGPEAAVMLAQAILEIAQGGGAAPAEEAPVYARKGGKLVKVSKK